MCFEQFSSCVELLLLYENCRSFFLFQVPDVLVGVRGGVAVWDVCPSLLGRAFSSTTSWRGGLTLGRIS